MEKGVLPILVVIWLAFIVQPALALPWKIPARWRVIYEINTDPITENNMVVIELNIPESIYDWVYYYADKGAFCEMAKGNSDVRWLYPVIYYVSTYNQEQRPPDSIYIVTSYQHAVQDCFDEFGNQIYLRLPKTVRITISHLDGGDDFKNYQHYIYIYQPQGFMNTAEWFNNGIRNCGWATGRKDIRLERYETISTNIDFPIDNTRYMFLKVSTAAYGSGSIEISFDVTMKDGETRNIRVYSRSGDCSTSRWVDVFNVLASARPLSDYTVLNTIKLQCGAYCMFCLVDDVYILVG